MLGRLNSRDVSFDFLQGRSHLDTRSSKNPPALPKSLIPVLVTLRFHRHQNVLVNLGELFANLGDTQSIEIDDFDSPGSAHKVASIAIISDMLVETSSFAEPEMLGLALSDNEAAAGQHDAVRRQSAAGQHGLGAGDV